MLEMIFVTLSVVGMFACWYSLYQNKDTRIIVELHTNKKIQVAGYITTIMIITTAWYFGWMVYAAIVVVSIPLDLVVKRHIFAR